MVCFGHVSASDTPGYGTAVTDCYDRALLVSSEYLYSSLFQLFQGFQMGMPIGIVFTALYHGIGGGDLI